MAKKKSKTQKSKKNQKKKVQTTQKQISQQQPEQKKVTPKQKSTNVNKKNTKPAQKQPPSKTNTNKQSTNKPVQKQVVDKKEVKYNVALSNQNKPEKEKQLVDKDKVEYNVVLTKPNKLVEKKETPKETPVKVENKFAKTVKKTLIKIKETSTKIVNNIKNKLDKTNKPQQTTKKYVKKDKKLKKKTKEVEKPKNIILRILFEIKNNLHIIFNIALIITYIILLIGLIRTNAFTKGAIIYISCIVIFLMIVAIGYNKYLSGKIFSICIIVAMSFGISNLQFTYDFINNLNSNQYEYKTYYVVTFNNGQNKSIYNINNKKVCLLKDNSVNIERALNTKLDSIIYVEHEDPNKMYQEFYNTDCRAIIVNENQYKYLKNNIEPNSRNVKILYEFKANGKK